MLSVINGRVSGVTSDKSITVPSPVPFKSRAVFHIVNQHMMCYMMRGVNKALSSWWQWMETLMDFSGETSRHPKNVLTSSIVTSHLTKPTSEHIFNTLCLCVKGSVCVFFVPVCCQIFLSWQHSLPKDSKAPTVYFPFNQCQHWPGKWQLCLKRAQHTCSVLFSTKCKTGSFELNTHCGH